MKWGVVAGICFAILLLVLHALGAIDLISVVNFMLHPSMDKVGVVIYDGFIVFLISTGIIAVVTVLIQLYRWITGRR